MKSLRDNYIFFKFYNEIRYANIERAADFRKSERDTVGW